MRLTLRDRIATLLVALAAVPYVGYLLRGEMPFIRDPRGMSAVGLVLGIAAFIVARRPPEAADRLTLTEAWLGTVALAAGVVAFVFAETYVAETLLALFMGAVAVAWLVEFLHHAGALPAPGGGR